MVQELHAKQTRSCEKSGGTDEVDSGLSADKNKKFVLIEDSIVRGTQLSETVSYLIENGAKEIHRISITAYHVSV